MNEIKDFAFSKTKQSGKVPAFGELIKDNSSGLFKSESFCVISQNSIDFYKPKGCNLKNSFSLLQLTSIKLNNDTLALSFSGKKKFEIESPQSINKIFGSIIHVLQNIMTNDEVMKLGLFQYGIQKNSSFFDCPLIRIKEKCAEANEILPTENYQLLERIIYRKEKKINFISFKNPTTIIPYVLDILPMCPYVENIEIPLLNFPDIFEFLTTFIPRLINVKHIEIQGKATSQTFSYFLQELGNYVGLPIQSLSFVDSCFQESDLRSLLAFIEKKRITALGFHNAISQTGMSFFLSPSFFSVAFSQNISLLNMDNTRDIQLPKLFQYLTSITSLSLVNCRLQIADVFACIQRFKLNNIKELNLSENVCTAIPNGIDFPLGCIRFVADDVQWVQSTLAILLYMIFDRTVSQISLSFDRARVSSTEWSNVFRVFWQSKFTNTLDFSWNMNPISPMLLGFLARQRILRSLSINGGLSEATPEAFQYFISFCNESTVKNISIRGEKTFKIGRMFGSVARGILAAKNLTSLDVSNNKIGDTGLEQIGQVLKRSKTLKNIVFDGSFPSTFNSVIKAVESISAVNISYPEEDAKYMLKNRFITKEQFESLKIMCSVVPQNNSSSLFVPEHSPFNKPMPKFVEIGIHPIFPVFNMPQTTEELRSIKLAVVNKEPVVSQSPSQQTPKSTHLRSPQQQQLQQQLQQQQSERRVPQRNEETPQRERTHRTHSSRHQQISPNESVERRRPPPVETEQVAPMRRRHSRRQVEIEEVQPVVKVEERRRHRHHRSTNEEIMGSPKRSSSTTLKASPKGQVSPKRVRKPARSVVDYDEDDFDDYNDVSLDLSEEHVPTPKPFKQEKYVEPFQYSSDYDDTRTIDY